ncbi:hypothetical protein OROGR_029601 [Orobanche gracilis]
MATELPNQEPQLQVHVVSTSASISGGHNHRITAAPPISSLFHRHLLSIFSKKRWERKENTELESPIDNEPTRHSTEARPQVELVPVNGREPSSWSSIRVPDPFSNGITNFHTELMRLVRTGQRVPPVPVESGGYVDAAGRVPEVPHVRDAS